jgi:PhoPQ-activated pathogenicity-related protein
MRKCLSQLAVSFLFLCCFAVTVAQQSITPATALKSYLNNKDTVFHWELKDSFNVGPVKAYDLLLTSQKWREFTWTHQLTIFLPPQVQHNDALLFITGGSDKNGLPNWNGPTDKLYKGIGDMALANKAITAVLRQTPNQPLFGKLTEDALISYTLHNFKNDGDYTWPLLFPMVKSAVRDMDAIQTFSKQNFHDNIRGFVVSGASKRGWTTWLTGANDKRVVAIAPMVIDVLNMPVSLEYQIQTWKKYSIEIEDYVKLGIPQEAKTESGTAINTMIDPYSYRKNLSMPKMLFMGTNDPYWVIDNVKNYIDSVPGKYLINYVPNAAHDLGDGKQAFEGLSAFFGITINHQKYPECKWKTSLGDNKDVLINISTTADKLVDVIVWSAASEDLDFRDEKWSSKSLGISHKSSLDIKEPLPASGYGAFYVDLRYKDNNGGTFLVSTRVFVTDSKKIL